jgi:hypothetical protein
MTDNGSLTGNPLNMTLRYKVRAWEPGLPYASTQYGLIIPYNHQYSAGAVQLRNPYLRVYLNNTGNTEFRVYPNVTLAPSDFINASFSFDYSKSYQIQANYNMVAYPSAGYIQAKGVFFCIDGVDCYDNSSMHLLTSGTIPGRINTTAFIIAPTQDACMAIDDLSVIAYDTGEAFISSNETLPIFVTASNNSYPQYDITTYDRFGDETDIVMRSTYTCTPQNRSDGTTYIHQGCQPLYIEFDYLFDIEGDTMSYMLDCAATLQQSHDDLFTDNASINQALGMSCDLAPYMYLFQDEVLYGVNLTEGDCAVPEHPLYSFSDDSLFPNYLVRSADWIVQLDTSFVPGITYGFEFLDFNYNTQITAYIILSNTTGYTDIYLGSEKVKEIQEALTEIKRLSFFIYTDGGFVIQLLDDAGRIYTTERATYSIPLALRSLYMTARYDNLSIAHNGYLIGNLKAFTYSPQESFNTFNTGLPVVLNCSQSGADEYTAVLIVTDDVHGENLENMRFIEYEVSNIAAYTGGIAPVGEDDAELFEALFGTSDIVKYMIALVIFLACLFGGVAAGVTMGNQAAGLYIGIFAAVGSLFFMALIGLIPYWIVILMFIVLAIIIAAFMRSMLIGGGV